MRSLFIGALILLSAAALAGEAKQLSPEGAQVSEVSLSPDGKLAVFMLNREDRLGGDVAVLDLATGVLTNLTLDDHPDAIYSEMESGPQFSPCGAWIFYALEEAIWRVSVPAGKAEKVFEEEGLRGFRVMPKGNALLLVVEQWVTPGELKVPIDRKAAMISATLLERYDLGTGKREVLSRNVTLESGRVEWLPDGRMVTIGNVGGGREIVVVDGQGKASPLGPALFGSYPVFLEGGERLVFVEQQPKEGMGWNYTQPTWSAKTLARGQPVGLPLPEGTELGSLWSVPGHRDLVVAAGNYDDGYRLYRYDGAKKTMTLIVDRVFGTADDGQVTPDGKALIFQGGGPGMARGPLMQVTL